MQQSCKFILGKEQPREIRGRSFPPCFPLSLPPLRTSPFLTKRDLIFSFLFAFSFFFFFATLQPLNFLILSTASTLIQLLFQRHCKELASSRLSSSPPQGSRGSFGFTKVHRLIALTQYLLARQRLLLSYRLIISTIPSA